jgi:hypothetical protein
LEAQHSRSDYLRSPKLDMHVLRSTWTDIYGRPPPKFISRRLLELVAAYDPQAKAYGGVKPATRRKLLQSASREPQWLASVPRHKPRATLAPGSRLVREWNGRSHTVEVAEHGVPSSPACSVLQVSARASLPRSCSNSSCQFS